MKHILFFLFISTGLLAQTPRLNLKQLTKDTTFGSVLISTPSDSGIVFSRDFYISYGADTVLILYGDTVGVGATLDAEQVQDIVGAMANAGLGIDITYNDTDGELLFESLSIEDSIKNETGTLIPIGTPLYATGVQGNYWTVAPADASDPTKLPVVVIAGENIADGATGLGLIKGHINGVNTGDFTAGDEIWLASGGGYTNIEPKGGSVYSQSLGTVIKVDASSGSGIINIQEPHQTLAPDHIFIGGADSLITSTEYIVDSTRINATGDTAYYYQNGVLIGTGAIAGGGGGSGTVTSVDVSGGTTGLTTSGGPITTSGTITLAGTLDVDNGGTGATSFTAGQILKGNGTSAIQSAINLRENGDTVVVEKILNVDSSFIVRNNEFEVHTRGSSDSRPAVAIGFTNSTPLGFKLEVSDTTTGSSTLRLNNDNTGGGLFLTKGGTAIMFNGSADTWAGGTVITNDAALGAYQSNIKFYTNNSGLLKAQLDASGNWTYLGVSSQMSDIKTKKNISLYEDGLSKILNLRPIYFTSIFDESNQVRLGFIAQEVQEILPELVKDYAHSGYMSLNVQGIIPVLTKAIQEQQAIIESQATEIEQLKTLITDLSNRLQILENN